MACMHICHACIQARSDLPILDDENGIEHRVGEHRALVQGWLKPRPQPLIKRRPQRLLEAHYIDDSCALIICHYHLWRIMHAYYAYKLEKHRRQRFQ